jgi:hypothetical protein
MRYRYVVAAAAVVVAIGLLFGSSSGAARRGAAGLHAGTAAANRAIARVDAARDRIPAGVGAVAVSQQELEQHGARTFPVDTVTARSQVRKLIALVDSRPLEQPGARACPTIGPGTTFFALHFLSAVGAQPVASVVEDGCGGLTFSSDGRTEPELEDNVDLAGFFWRLGILQRCSAARLRGSSTNPRRFPAPVEMLWGVELRDLSSSVCGLDGYPRVQLRAATGKALSTHVTYSPYPPQVAVLGPTEPGGIVITWPPADRSCEAPRAGLLDVTLPHSTAPLVIRVASARHPIAPCNGQITVDAIA